MCVFIESTLVNEAGLSASSNVDTMVNEASDVVCNSDIGVGPFTVEFNDSSDTKEDRMRM